MLKVKEFLNKKNAKQFTVLKTVGSIILEVVRIKDGKKFYVSSPCICSSSTFVHETIKYETSIIKFHDNLNTVDVSIKEIKQMGGFDYRIYEHIDINVIEQIIMFVTI
jgi:hypothetical protein